LVSAQQKEKPARKAAPAAIQGIHALTSHLLVVTQDNLMTG